MAQKPHFLKNIGSLCFFLFSAVQIGAQNYLPVLKGDKYAFVDTSGTEVIGPQFTAARRFSEGLAAVSVHPAGSVKLSYMNASRSIVVKKFFLDARPFKDSIAAVFNGKTWNYIDHHGTMLNTRNLSEAGDFTGDFARARIKDKWGLMYKDGSFRIEPRFSECTDLQYGVFAVLNFKEKHWTFLNLLMDTVIRKNYDGAGSFGDSLAPVKLLGKWGYINLQGETLIPFEFEEATPFAEGLACVKKEGKWYFIDRKGNQVLPIYLASPGTFFNGVAEVQTREGEEVYLTKGGRIIPKKQ